MATAVPPLRTVDDLVLELIGDIAQNISAYRIMLAISVEETDHSRLLLERLNQPAQQGRPERRATSRTTRLSWSSLQIRTPRRRTPCRDHPALNPLGLSMGRSLCNTGAIWLVAGKVSPSSRRWKLRQRAAHNRQVVFPWKRRRSCASGRASNCREHGFFMTWRKLPIRGIAIN